MLYTSLKVLAIMVQYWAIVQMRRISAVRVIEVIMADMLSLVTFEILLFGWMGLIVFFTLKDHKTYIITHYDDSEKTLSTIKEILSSLRIVRAAEYLDAGIRILYPYE